jgi:hypothetical protein
MHRRLWISGYGERRNLFRPRVASDLDYGNDRLAILPAMIMLNIGELWIKMVRHLAHTAARGCDKLISPASGVSNCRPRPSQAAH